MNKKYCSLLFIIFLMAFAAYPLQDTFAQPTTGQETVLGENIDIASFAVGAKTVMMTLTSTGATQMSATTIVSPNNKGEPTTRTTCGDGYCDLGETNTDCADDCPPIPKCGEVNMDGYVDFADIEYIIDWKYRGGSPPVEEWRADTNNDGNRNLLDIVVLIEYLYKAGPEPNCTEP